MTEEKLVQDIDRWGLRMGVEAAAMQFVFYLGVLFAFAFVLAIAVTGGV